MYEVYLFKILFVTSIIFIGLMGQRIINKILDVYNEKVASKTKTKLDDELIPLIRRLSGIGIWIISIIIILSDFGVNVLGIYAGLGIGSMITVMCVKESIINIIAGITIMFDRPFRVGDRVKLHTGDKGYIHRIGLRRTQICIPDDDKIGYKSILVIPNRDISKFKIYNYTFAEELEND